MKYKILSNVLLAERRLLLELAVPARFKTAGAGQFLHIRIEETSDPLLRRPLSIHDVLPSRKKDGLIARVLYEIVGKGTELLAEKKALSGVDCLGPLGNGFDLKMASGARDVYIVAGGMGVAPLFFLARKIKQSKTKSKINVLIGARTKGDILREREFRNLGCKVHVATEDGSKGFKGRATDLLEKLLPGATSEPRAIYACGPKAMLAKISDIAWQNNIRAQVSMEEFMGCGLGACLGCVIRTTSGYKRICHDGPVFDASEILWGGVL